jgi:hypothetical protein
MIHYDIIRNTENYKDIHLKRYIKFIKSRPERNLKKEKGFHIHHIIPKSLNGSENKENKIKLTYREHFIAHLILWKCCSGKMAEAFFLMNQNKIVTNKYIKLNSKQYSILTEECSNIKSINSKGKNNPNFGKKHSEEIIYKMKNNRKPKEEGNYKKGENHYNYGKKIPEEIRKKISKAIKEKYKILEIKPNKKGVILLEKKEFFDSVTEAAIKYNLSKANISYCCINVNKTCGGYHWMFSKDFDINKEYTFERFKNSSQKIICLETKVIYNSMNEAEKLTGIRADGISLNIRNLRYHAGGFHWLLLKNYDENKEYLLEKRSYQFRYRKIENINTKEIFDSIKEASEKYNIPAGNITRNCQGSLKSAGGYKWKYLD